MAVYYVDGVSGSDDNDGTTELLAWQTIGKAETESANMVAGDFLLFKAGQTFDDSFTYGGASGTLGNEVVISAYGTGARPIITVIGEKTGTWTDEGSNKWSLPSAYKTTRLWKNGVEQKSTSPVAYGETWNEFGLIAGCVWIWDSDVLYFYSETDPNLDTFTGATKYTTLKFDGVSNVKLASLDMRGGSSYCLGLKNCTYIDAYYNDIGYDGAYGLVVNNSTNIKVRRNRFDTNFKLIFDGVSTYTGTDVRGCSDGIAADGLFKDSEIMYNDFINWGHSAIGLTGAIEADEVSGNKVYNNYLTAPDLHYSRALSWSGDFMKNNEVYNNYADVFYIRSQLNGVSNHFHHNHISNIHRTPYKDGEDGQGFALESYSGNPTGNLYEYNTIEYTESAGMELVASGDVAKPIQGNTFNKNLFTNCGTNTWYASSENKGVKTEDFVDILDNTYTDNAFSDTGSTILHRGVS